MSAPQIKPAPITKHIVVKANQAKAFAIFTGSMGDWWPKGQTVGASSHKEIVIEPRPGGRWFERSEDGAETNWGRVLAWEPPDRVLLAWKLDRTFKFDPNFETQVDVTFKPEGTDATRVTLEHRNIERFGEGAEKFGASLDKGWGGFLKVFADYVESSGTTSKGV